MITVCKQPIIHHEKIALSRQLSLDYLLATLYCLHDAFGHIGRVQCTTCDKLRAKGHFDLSKHV